MASPVWLDGPLSRAVHEVPDETVEQGMYRYSERDVYTFTLVEVFQHRLVVASVRTGVLDFQTLFERLMTPEAQQAAQ
jgi:hypothetical protein